MGRGSRPRPDLRARRWLHRQGLGLGGHGAPAGRRRRAGQPVGVVTAAGPDRRRRCRRPSSGRSTVRTPSAPRRSCCPTDLRQPQRPRGRLQSVRILATLALLVTLSGCQWGPPPRIPYVDGTTYVEPDGHRDQLTGPAEGRRQRDRRRYDGGHLVADTRFFEGTSGWPRGRRRAHPSSGRARPAAGVPSDDRDRVAWLTMGCPESNLRGRAVVHVADTVGSRRMEPQPGPAVTSSSPASSVTPS